MVVGVGCGVVVGLPVVVVALVVGCVDGAEGGVVGDPAVPVSADMDSDRPGTPDSVARGDGTVGRDVGGLVPGLGPGMGVGRLLAVRCTGGGSAAGV